MSARSVVIIGGGASGILLAAHLLRRSDERLHVTVIEKRGQLGRGLAFSASQTNHILNVPAGSMSAYVDEPDHFRAWLARVHPELPADPFLFAPRQHYGAYLADVLHSSEVNSVEQTRLTTVTAEVVALREAEKGVEITLSDGTVRFGDVAVLAVGHEEQPSRGRGIAVRADSPEDTPLPADAPVLILGSGLSMVDAWLSLSARQHRGQVTIVSRHGLLPLPHSPSSPIKIDAADVPFGTNLHYFTRWFRDLVEANLADGGDWRSVVDGLRPYNQRIWQNWTPEARRQFLEHVRPLWNIHRHRLPPRLHALMQNAINSGQVQLVPGKLVDLERRDGGVAASFRRRGKTDPETITVARVYDCGGVTLDVDASSNPAILSLLKQRQARADVRHIGLDVTTDLHVVDANGEPSPRIYAVGPLTRGKFFEIEAIPDIRRQVADLAGRLLA
ncbi:MAG: FAD/NAD(P)-binding protein [Devosia sp.]|nr:FAD/NAD(P)-binding protein [Devosia sp.]